MVIFPLAPDQTIAQMWSNGARGGVSTIQWFGLFDKNKNSITVSVLRKIPKH